VGDLLEAISMEVNKQVQEGPFIIRKMLMEENRKEKKFLDCSRSIFICNPEYLVEDGMNDPHIKLSLGSATIRATQWIINASYRAKCPFLKNASLFSCQNFANFTLFFGCFLLLEVYFWHLNVSFIMLLITSTYPLYKYITFWIKKFLVKHFFNDIIRDF
jgi:hypothetical protein